MLTGWTLRKLRSDDYLVRERAKEKLVAARAIRPLIAALGDGRSSQTALRGLVEIGDIAREELAHALDGAEPRVRSLSAVALARLGDMRSIPVLLETVDDPAAGTFSKAESIRLLGKLEVDAARDRIRASLNEPGLSEAAASALIDFGAFEDLLTAAEAGHLSAIRSLGSFGDPRALDSLAQLLDNASSDIRTAAVKALGELRDTRAAEPLLKLFQDLRGRLREVRPDHYGFVPDWVASSKRELAAIVSSLGGLRDERAHEPIGNLLYDERAFVQDAIASGNGSCLYGSSEILKSGVRAIAEYGDSNDLSGIHLLIALMERGKSAAMGWQVGGWERSREFQDVLAEAELSFEILQKRMARNQAEQALAAETGAGPAGVSVVVFRPASAPAPADTAVYCRRIFDGKFAGRTLGQWRVVGVQEPMAQSEASALYRRMVVEGKLPYFGHERGGVQGAGPDGIDVVALFLSQQEIEPAGDETGGGGNVSPGDLDKIAAYWRRLGKQWWLEQEASRTSAVCDQCNSAIARGQGFLHGAYLLCERCCESRLATDALERLREDPNYFGAGLLEEARASANSAETG